MSNPTNEKVSFLSDHQPALKSDDYTITVEQKRGNIPGDASPAFKASKTIFVGGERFTIPQSKVYSCFPPPGSLGDHSNDLPHIMLTRSTLPWERFAQSGNLTRPWLFLFVFDDNDIKAGNVKVSTTTIGGIIKLADPLLPPTSTSDTINLKKETGDTALNGNKQNTVEINSNWASTNLILPDNKDLALMTGVRVNSDATAITTVSTPEGVTEMAMCIANRLPTPGVKSYAHLLSLENRFASGEDTITLNQESATDTFTSFISLTDWSFTCVAESNESFSELLKTVDQGGLNLPGIGSATADQYLSRGAVAFPHHLKNGGETVSWYHGPLVSGDSSDNSQGMYDDKLIQSSDDLLRLDSDLGMLDTSYAAAWELGRMLTLNNKDMAMQMYAWKRQQSWSQQQAQNDLFHDLLPANVSEAKALAKSEQWSEIQAWFKSLNLLENVPFNYLIPDEKLLPQESIRFFQLDNFWISCLMDGAYSIGRVTQTETQRDYHTKNSYGTGNYEQISGFLLRSKAVSGWPALMVEAPKVKPTTPAPTPDCYQLLRMERLAPDILLCLFEGDAQYFDIHLKPESIHFGFTPPDTGDLLYTKDIKFSFQTKPATETAKIAWANGDSSNRVVDLTAVKTNIEVAINNANTGANSNLNPAQFALNMVKGVPKIVFDKGTAATVTEDTAAIGTDETDIASELETSDGSSASFTQVEGGSSGNKGTDGGNTSLNLRGSDTGSSTSLTVGSEESAKDKVEGWIEPAEEELKGKFEHPEPVNEDNDQNQSNMDQDTTKTSDLEKVIEKLEDEFPKASADLKDFLEHKKQAEQGLDPKEKGSLKYDIKKAIGEIKDLEPEVTDEVKEKLDEIKDKIDASPIFNLNSARVRKAWVVTTLILLVVSTILFTVTTIIDRERPKPLVFHFQGVKEMQEIEFVKQDYEELVPVATKDGELEFLLTVPASVSGKMDMTMMEYEVEGDTVIKVTLPNPIVSDPVLNLAEVKDYYDRGGGDKLFLSGGGASYTKAYEQIISSMEDTKKGILANAVKDDIIEQTNKKARSYLINMAGVTGYRIEFVLKEPDPPWEDDMKKRLGKTYDKVKNKVEGHSGILKRLKDDLSKKKTDDTKTESK